MDNVEELKEGEEVTHGTTKEKVGRKKKLTKSPRIFEKMETREGK